MKVLSLFDGISCGMAALIKAEKRPTAYYASEIDESAIAISRYNYGKRIHRLSDVRQINTNILPVIDLMIGGSPCTDLSFAGKLSGLGVDFLESYLDLKEYGFKFSGQSYLFWEYVRIYLELKPKYFLLENVKMKVEQREIIDSIFGKPIYIDSKDFSGGFRKRFYWTNIPIPTKIVNGYRVLVGDYKSPLTLGDAWAGGIDVTDRFLSKTGNAAKYARKNIIGLDRKARSITSKGQILNNYGAMIVDWGDGSYSVPCPKTCEALMTMKPDFTQYGRYGVNRTEEMSDRTRYKAIGNGWTIDVITEILKYLEK